MLLDTSSKIEIQDLGTLGVNETRLKIARLDKIHPVISGNKLFKLHYFLEEFNASGKTAVASFGGAYSNHLVATAFAAHVLSVPSTGFIRGDRQMNPSLKDCENYGMELVFIERSKYSSMTRDYSELESEYPQHYFIPEGGYSPTGARGAALITESIRDCSYTHLATSAGTATTLAGLLRNNKCSIIAVPALKGMHDLAARVSYLNQKPPEDLDIWDTYHFGGYGKTNSELFGFMNMLYSDYNLPTDIIYTSKLLYAIFDKINQGYFPLGSEVLCLHTGGLQGNRSLTAGILDF